MKKYWVLFLLLSFLGTLFGFALEPDLDLYLIRRIPSQLSPDRLERNISSLTRWPQWFHSLSKASVIGGASGFNDFTFQNGSILQLKIDPLKGKRKLFDLTLEVTDYQPAKRLHLKVVDDSSGRLTRLFDRLDWNIEILPQSNGSQLIATTIAHTRSWKARLFGRLSEKILMNQVFYPNLIQLSELKQPFSVDQDLIQRPPGL